MEKIVKILINRYEAYKRKPYPFIDDIEAIEANKFLNDIENNPHVFVLACLMDRQIPTRRAWIIPQKVSNELNTYNFKKWANMKKKVYIDIFNREKLHRFNTNMANIFYDGIQRIKEKYNGDASEIWRGKPSSSSVVRRFLEFNGCGIKIATMAANILATKFKIPFSDYFSIDISPDVHIKRVLPRMGLIPFDLSPEMLMYMTRELYPKFPGIIDFPCWEIGRTCCKPNKPDCSSCIVETECKKIIKTQKP